MVKSRSFLRPLFAVVVLFALNVICWSQPAVYSVDPAALREVKAKVRTADKQLMVPFKKLLRDADKALSQDIGTVMDKSQAPESGTKHDYFSLARYFWPDPAKPDGLPYIQRDGETNPEIEQVTDRENFDHTADNSMTLALAYYLTGEEKYAEKSAAALRRWFLDTATCMNPNLNYGQVVKGKKGGRPSGLIEMREMHTIVDAVGLLAGSRSWTDADHAGMKSWFERYLAWLDESPIAKKELASTNNHGTWVHVQKASIALFLGKNDLAKSLLSETKEKVIAAQVTAEGEMPRELARTRSLHYTYFNIEAMFALASIASNAGVDLWTYQTEDGRSIRKALDWVLPYVLGQKSWENKQIDEFKPEKFYPILVQAARQFKDESYLRAAGKIGGENAPKNKVNLLYPQE